MTDRYTEFLASKRRVDPFTGLTGDIDLPAAMFPHQADITRWAIRRGRAALFAGTGLGKSFMELAWAAKVVEHTGKPVLHLAPLAVTAQMVREAEKFGMDARQVVNQSEIVVGDNVTNYQKLEYFDLSAFGGVILDESSILKSTDGHYRTKLIEACQKIPFRLAATATPAPNDFMELGNHAEFLGIMSYTDMLATFFVHDGGDTQKWRLKGHAENEFWRWMASWAVMLRKPSDLGYSDDGYDLPPLSTIQHTVSASKESEDGNLFPAFAATMSERISARRDTVTERVDAAIELVANDFRDKLLECLSQKNAAPITAHTTLRTNQNGETEPEKSETSTTPIGVKSTQQTKRTEKNSNPLREADAESVSETAEYETTTESQPSSTTNSLGSKITLARYADLDPDHVAEAGWQSTIAMTQAAFADSCALTAIVDLDCSPTIETGSTGQSNISTRLKLSPWVIWCHLNSEQDAAKRALGDLAISIHGGHSEEEKEQLHLDWLDGKAPVLICKPKMFAHGCNWQHCNKTVFVGLNDSFEQVYQAVRRFWRFGQTQPVTVHMIAADVEGAVVANLKRKEADANRMAAAMVMHMADISSQAVRGMVRDTPDYNPQVTMTVPAWLTGEQAA